MKKILAATGALALAFAFGVAVADEMPSFDVDRSTANTLYLEHAKTHKDMGVPEAKGSGAGGTGSVAADMKQATGTWKFFDQVYKLLPQKDLI